LYARSDGMPPSPTPPPSAPAWALPFFSERLLQDAFVQREIGYELLQLSVLFLELLQFTQLRDTQAAVLLLPAVERGLGDLQLAADLSDRRTGLRLPQGHRNLLLGESTLSHGRLSSPSSGIQVRPQHSSKRDSKWIRFRGEGQA